MKALILASGEGTRLRPLTEKVNKGMLLVGGKPIFERIIEHLKKYGYTDIVMAVGVKKEQVMDYFGDGSKFGVKINYSISEDVQGTAGEIAKARNFLEEGEDFIVYYGDTLTEINLNLMEQVHKHNNAMITTPVISGIPLESSFIESLTNGQVIKFLEKPVLLHKANIPVFIVNRKVLNHPNVTFGKDFSSDVIPDIVGYGGVFEYDEDRTYNFIDYSNFILNSKCNYHYDVGTISRYEKICELFDNNKVGSVKVIK